MLSRGRKHQEVLKRLGLREFKVEGVNRKVSLGSKIVSLEDLRNEDK